MKTKSTIYSGTIKTGLMEIKMGEVVKVIKTTSKMIYVEKNGMVKAFDKNLFN